MPVNLAIIQTVGHIKKMKKEEGFKFKGDWEFKVTLADLNKLDWERSEETINMIICDFLDDEFEPSKEQINAINYIIRNQTVVLNLIINTIWSNWNEIYDQYEYGQFDKAPEVKSKNDIERIISLHRIYIDTFHKNGMSYIGIEGDCLWDQEHGIGLVIHENRLIQFGEAEEANARGLSEDEKPDNERPKDPEFLKMYLEHPTFKTLKPSHKEANFEFPYKLIAKGLGKEFIEWIEEGYDVDYIPPKQWNKESYLVTACIHDNIAAFIYLVNHVTNFDGAIQASLKRRNIWFLDLLLKKELEIENDQFIEVIKSYLYLLSENLTEEKMNLNQKKWIDFYNSVGVSFTENITIIERVSHPKEIIVKTKILIEWLKNQQLMITSLDVKNLLSKYSDSSDKFDALSIEMEWILSK